MNHSKFSPPQGFSELTGISSKCGIRKPCSPSSYYDSQEAATNQDKENIDRVNSVIDNSKNSSLNDSSNTSIIEHPDSYEDALFSEQMSIRSHAVEVLLKAYRMSERRSKNCVDLPATATSHKDKSFDATVTSTPATQDGYSNSPIASTQSSKDEYSDLPMASTQSTQDEYSNSPMAPTPSFKNGYSDSPMASTPHQDGNSLKSKLKFKLLRQRFMKKKMRSTQLSSANGGTTSMKEKENADLLSSSFQAEDYRGKHKTGCAYLTLPYVSEPSRDFFLPKPDFPCTCGAEHCSALGSDEDLIDLRSMLRPWQVDFLANLNITTPLDLIQAQRCNAKQVAFAMISWRAKKKMSDMDTKSCLIALHIWAEAIIEYLQAANTNTENLDYPPLSEIIFTPGNGSLVGTRSSLGINSMVRRII